LAKFSDPDVYSRSTCRSEQAAEFERRLLPCICRTVVMSSSHISSWLFPISQYESGFSTTQSDIDTARVSRVPLADSSVGVHKSSSRLTHNLVTPPTRGDHSPRVAWEAFFPEGSINPSATIPGGFGFYLKGPPEFAARLESATEALFSYRVMFEDGWDFQKGGKLPGHCLSASISVLRLILMYWHSWGCWGPIVPMLWRTARRAM
jgi:hypothetical protein